MAETIKGLKWQAFQSAHAHFESEEVTLLLNQSAESLLRKMRKMCPLEALELPKVSMYESFHVLPHV